jgi:hypothetical protein
MPLSLRHKFSRLPKRFPVGSTFVIEGRAVPEEGDNTRQLQVFSRFVVLPGGSRIDLGPNSNASTSRWRGRGRQRPAVRPEPPAKKNIERVGTTLRRYR